MKRDYSKHLRRFHEAKWDEELIFDLSVPGQRGVNVTKPSPQITEEVGDGADDIPPCMRRKTPPFLPEGTPGQGQPPLSASDPGNSGQRHYP